jgi:hypothetical protein
MKVVYAAGSNSLEQYGEYPEIITAPDVPLAIEFVDFNGDSVSSPSFSMEARNTMGICQSTPTNFGNDTQGTLLRVYKNSGSDSWNTTIAPTSGSTALWTRAGNTDHYDFNDPSGTPGGCNSGSDGDGFAGQLSFGTDTTVIWPKSGCTTDNLTWNVNDVERFSQGVQDAITILSGSSATTNGCYWDIGGTEITQSIPAYQSPGDYQLDLTATIVAQ